MLTGRRRADTEYCHGAAQSGLVCQAHRCLVLHHCRIMNMSAGTFTRKTMPSAQP